MKILFATLLAGGVVGLQVGSITAIGIAPDLFAMTLVASAGMGAVIGLAIGSLLYSFAQELNRQDWHREW